MYEFRTRRGGVSRGNYSEFNINEYCGDEANAMVANRKLLCQKLDISDHCLIFPHQVHGVEVRQIDGDFTSMDFRARKEMLEGIDAVMTNQKGLCIGVSTADCIPVLLYDHRNHACAAIHAGWRGTVARIVQKTIHLMISSYHTQPEELQAVIGPGISLENFEVGNEVYEQFDKAGFDMSSIARRFERWHIDLWECNRKQLIHSGVLADNIQVAGICTFANTGEYFSARRLGINSGRIFTAIMMKDHLKN